MKKNRIQGIRIKAILIIALVAIGIALGSIVAYVLNTNETKDILVLDFVNGKVILDAEDRELLKEKVINITLEDDQVKELTAGRNFTTYVTLAKSLQHIEDITIDDSSRRIHIEFDYVAVVTLMFEDGSGYTIQVNWEEWTVGEPEYSQQISPPESIVRIGPADLDERRSTMTG
ncbi:MAG: hypothetical protein NWE84_05630 [Candidatus Bathyarchaeota archaeon]|nr:hypothetical protein [Candidatus Bathyarchaeota archaeon]